MNGGVERGKCFLRTMECREPGSNERGIFWHLTDNDTVIQAPSMFELAFAFLFTFKWVPFSNALFIVPSSPAAFPFRKIQKKVELNKKGR